MTAQTLTWTLQLTCPFSEEGMSLVLEPTDSRQIVALLMLPALSVSYQGQ